LLDRSRTVATVRSMGLLVRRCCQCSAGEVVEYQQFLLVLEQVFDGLAVLGLVGCGCGADYLMGPLLISDFS
jgi:hypothetical protein